MEPALRYVLDESEFLSPHGVRSLPRVYKDRLVPIPGTDGDPHEYAVAYVPGDTWTRSRCGWELELAASRFGSRSTFC